VPVSPRSPSASAALPGSDPGARVWAVGCHRHATPTAAGDAAVKVKYGRGAMRRSARSSRTRVGMLGPSRWTVRGEGLTQARPAGISVRVEQDDAQANTRVAPNAPFACAACVRVRSAKARGEEGNFTLRCADSADTCELQMVRRRPRHCCTSNTVTPSN